MKEKRKQILLSVFGIMIVAVLSIVGYYVYEGVYFVSTEDAKIAGDIVRVSPKIVGELQEFTAVEGQEVAKDDVLGRQSLDNVMDSNFDLALIKAPISGKIIKKQGTIGETVAPGQVLVMLVDTKKMYITANIEETKVGKLKVGQRVDIKIDQFGNKNFKGTVSSIGQASASTFSMFPSSSGTTFTKVVQKIPVNIDFEHDNSVLLGTNAIVKIHVK